MNRRTAMVTSAGIVIAMLVAGLAMTMGLTGPSADARSAGRRPAPRVRTTTETVTIHRKADAASVAPATYRVVRTAASAARAPSLEDDETWDEEDEAEDHDEGEGDEGTEDQEDSSSDPSDEYEDVED